MEEEGQLFQNTNVSDHKRSQEGHLVNGEYEYMLSKKAMRIE